MLTLRFTDTVPYCVWRAHVGPSGVPVSGGPATSRPDKLGIPTWALLSWYYTQQHPSHLQDLREEEFTGWEPHSVQQTTPPMGVVRATGPSRVVPQVCW